MALHNCRKCYDSTPDDQCTQTCASQYVQFMQLKEFVLLPNPKLTMKDVDTVVALIDNL